VTAPLLALGGPPGSGKSTAASRLATRLGLQLHIAGDLFRARAGEKGMDLLAFSRFAEEHPEVDLEIDEAMAALAEPGRLLEGRLVGEFLRRRGIAATWVAVTAKESVRAERIAERDGMSATEALSALRERERSERERYQRLYGIDVDGVKPDLTVDSSALTPDEVVDRIMTFLQRKERRGR
jgi:CMP/dCMP kinase